MNIEELKVLRAPFPKEKLGVKVQSFSKDKTRAMLICYLQHTDVQERLEEVDPAWTCEVAREEYKGDTVYIHMRMTVSGVTRENVGEGNDPKSAYSDAIKRCAMLFGVGRYLYDADQVWVPYSDSNDRFRTWTHDDYARGLRPNQSGVGLPDDPAERKPEPRRQSPAPVAPLSPVAPVQARAEEQNAERPKAPGTKTQRDKHNREIMDLYTPFLKFYPDTNFQELLTERYGARETKLLSVSQLGDLVRFMREMVKAKRGDGGGMADPFAGEPVYPRHKGQDDSGMHE